MRERLKKIARLAVLIIIIVVVARYSYGRTKNIIFGPQIEITNPENGAIIIDDLITVSGRVKNTARLYLNDYQIFTDKDGNFNEELFLHYGYNIIEISAQDRVGKEKIKVLGIPISVKFLTPYHREEISSNLGFDENLRSVLIMGGGLGIGPIKSIAKALDDLDCDFQIIVVCGKNKSLYEWFSKNKGDFKKPVSNFGYVDFIHKIMDFSDIIITKAGGITISEALAKGLCIVLVKPIPGQEERNVHYLSKAKAVVKAEDHKQIPNLIGEFFKDKKKLYQLRERAKETSFIDSSLRIVDLIFELIS